MKKKISVVFIFVAIFIMIIGNYCNAETECDNDISTVKISLANGQSSDITVGEKVYLDIEIPESITNVDLTFSLEENNEDNIGYLTFESTVKDLKTKPYIIIPELENEKLR